MKPLFLLVVAIGVLNVVRPGLGLRTQRWQWRSSGHMEPSAAYIVMARLADVVMILGGLYGLAGGFTNGY